MTEPRSGPERCGGTRKILVDDWESPCPGCPDCAPPDPPSTEGERTQLEHWPDAPEPIDVAEAECVCGGQLLDHNGDGSLGECQECGFEWRGLALKALDQVAKVRTEYRRYAAWAEFTIRRHTREPASPYPAPPKVCPTCGSSDPAKIRNPKGGTAPWHPARLCPDDFHTPAPPDEEERCEACAQKDALLRVLKGTNERLDADLERLTESCPHADMTLTGDGFLRCDRCGQLEPDPFYEDGRKVKPATPDVPPEERTQSDWRKPVGGGGCPECGGYPSLPVDRCEHPSHGAAAGSYVPPVPSAPPWTPPDVLPTDSELGSAVARLMRLPVWSESVAEDRASESTVLHRDEKDALDLVLKAVLDYATGEPASQLAEARARAEEMNARVVSRESEQRLVARQERDRRESAEHQAEQLRGEVERLRVERDVALADEAMWDEAQARLTAATQARDRSLEALRRIAEYDPRDNSPNYPYAGDAPKVRNETPFDTTRRIARSTLTELHSSEEGEAE